MGRKLVIADDGMKDYLMRYFTELRKSIPLIAEEEKELFRKNEEYMLTILCELMNLTEFWNELDRILNTMIETACFPTEFFDITKAEYEDLEKKTNKKQRQELAAKIKMTLAKIANYYKISKAMYKVGKKKKVIEKFDQMAELRASIGLTIDFIHHMRNHIARWYEEEKKEKENILKDEELKKAELILAKIREISRNMRRETHKLYSSNLRLTVTVARKYHIQNTELLDFIQEGNMALAKAIEKFDWRRGTKFSTYAVPWLRQAIMRSMNDNIHPVRMPGHVVELMNKISKTMRNFFLENGRDPSIYEISEALNTPVEKIETIFKLLREPISFEAPSTLDDEGNKPADFVTYPDSLTNDEVFDTMERQDIINKIRKVINTELSSKERKIIELRCGITTNKEATLDEISAILNMTRERVRQIEQRAMKKLKKCFADIIKIFKQPVKKNGTIKLNGKSENGEKINGERMNGEKMNGERMSGKRMNGERINGERMNGKVKSDQRRRK